MQFSVSIEQLREFTPQFWAAVKDARVFAFHGDMGAGKTTIISALCRFKGVPDNISSPTFSIINEYTFEESGKVRNIFHMDLYRLESMEEIMNAGVDEYLNSGNICMIEWPEKAPDLFKPGTVHVYIRTTSETERVVDIRLPDFKHSI